MQGGHRERGLGGPAQETVLRLRCPSVSTTSSRRESAVARLCDVPRIGDSVRTESRQEVARGWGKGPPSRTGSPLGVEIAWGSKVEEMAHLREPTTCHGLFALNASF